MVATPGWEKTVRFVDLAILMIYIYIHNINGAAPPRLGELGGQGTIQSEKSVQVHANMINISFARPILELLEG
jgi:hypothetical protein